MINSWDIKEKSDKGDNSPSVIFEAVGAALSSWEHLEMEMAEMFDALMESPNRMGFKVYASSKTSSLRNEMLKAAIEHFPHNETLKIEITALVKKVGNFGARRNEIAHGSVQNLGEYGFYLCPSTLIKNKWTSEGAAKFQYTANDLWFYIDHFEGIRKEMQGSIKNIKSTIFASNGK